MIIAVLKQIQSVSNDWQQGDKGAIKRETEAMTSKVLLINSFDNENITVSATCSSCRKQLETEGQRNFQNTPVYSEVKVLHGDHWEYLDMIIGITGWYAQARFSTLTPLTPPKK